MTAIRNISTIFITAFLLLFASGYSEETAQDSDDKSLHYASEGKFEEAKKEVLKELESNPFNRRAQESLLVIEDVINEKIKKDTALRLFEGEMSYSKGSFDNAINAYDAAITAEPDYYISYVKRGVAHTRNRKYQSALSDFDRAIELRPEYSVSYTNHGIVYAKQKQFNEAISDYNLALEIEPGDPDAYYNRGVAHGKLGKYVLAILDYDRVTEIIPKYTNAYTNRGFIYLMNLENKKMACADWDRACELGECGNYTLAKENGFCDGGDDHPSQEGAHNDSGHRH